MKKKFFCFETPTLSTQVLLYCQKILHCKRHENSPDDNVEKMCKDSLFRFSEWITDKKCICFCEYSLGIKRTSLKKEIIEFLPYNDFNRFSLTGSVSNKKNQQNLTENDSLERTKKFAKSSPCLKG